MFYYTLNLRIIRKQKSISQKRLALLINTSQGFISELENYEKSPSLKTIVRISNALKISPYDLFEFQVITETTFIPYNY